MSRRNQKIIKYTADSILESIEKYGIEDTVFIVRQKDKEADNKWLVAQVKAIPVGGDKRVLSNLIILHRTKDDPITITSSLPDPSDKNDIRVKNKYGPSIETKLSCSGSMGKLVDILDKYFAKTIEKMQSDGTIDTGNREISPVVKRINSSKKEIPEKYRGMPKADPSYRFKVDFKRWSPNHPKKTLQNKVKTMFYDFARTKVVQNKKTKKNKIEYELCTVNGKSISEKNVHHVIQDGFNIRKTTLFMDSPNFVHDAWISWPILATDVVVDMTADEGDDDDEDEVVDANEFAAPEVKVQSTKVQETKADESESDDEKSESEEEKSDSGDESESDEEPVKKKPVKKKEPVKAKKPVRRAVSRAVKGGDDSDSE